MPEIAQLIQFIEQRFKNQIRAHTVMDAVPGDLAPFPDALDHKILEILDQQGITSLYRHQADAFESISQGQHTVLVSRTASGKTLSFLLPILNDYLQAPSPFSVLLLYPTKALSRDQEGTLGKLLASTTKAGRFGTFDGDTPAEERTRIQRGADFMITNPDMLHSGILPNHNRRWKSFLSRLKYIVVDEVHTYRGAFGSHVANVFRRLARVCEIYGSKPVFVCSSATIGNPQDHVQALFGPQFKVIDNDGAPRPKRHLYLINPPTFESHGHARYRKGPAAVSIPIMTEAAKHTIRSICFCRARQHVERLHRAVVDQRPELRDKVKPYRGGLLPNERRQLERDLFEGRINTIISTNALELGIDIGDLDLCLLSGHPGTIASFWQQAGRVGRHGSEAVIVFIAKDRPVDQYLVNHPDFVTSTPVEHAWLNADNPYILLQHLPCAAHEHPLRQEEELFTGDAYDLAVEILRENKTVVPYHDCLRYALRDYPARGVNLRGMTDYNIEIYCGTVVIGELDPIGARKELFKDAIYQHLGKRYMSMELDLEKKLCRVDEVNVDYYTEAVWEGRVSMTEVEETHHLHEHRLEFGPINVNKQPKLYKKIRERSYENIGYGPITLEPFIYDTMGFCLWPAPTWQAALDGHDKRFVSAAMHGLSYILRHSAPSICMADIRDIDTDVSLIEVEPEVWKTALFVFDRIEGGVGFAEKICEQFHSALTLARDIIESCDCPAGCPSCVSAMPPGVNSDELSQLLMESNAAVACTRSLLTALLDNEIRPPEIVLSPVANEPAVNPPGEDEARRRLQGRLNRAAKILQHKRERLH